MSDGDRTLCYRVDGSRRVVDPGLGWQRVAARERSTDDKAFATRNRDPEPMPSRRAFLASLGAFTVAAGHAPAIAAVSAPGVTWERSYAPDTASRTLVRDIVPLADDFGLVGLAGEDENARGWIARVDPAGRPSRQDCYGTGRTGFVAGAPPPAASDGLVAAGVANSPTTPASPDRSDPYVLQAGPGDAVRWARTYQPAAVDGQANAIVRVANGTVVAGSQAVDGQERPWAAQLDAEGTRTWTWTADQTGDVNAAVGAAGGAVIGGSTWPAGADVPAPRASLEGAWIARLTPDGDLDWRWHVDRANGDRIEGMAGRPDGGVVAVGRRGFATDDSGVGWLVALDGDGRRQWAQTYPQETYNWLQAVAPLEDGYALVGTREEGQETDARGAWVLRVGDDGQPGWDYQAKTGTRGFAVLPAADGGLLVGGATTSDGSDIERGWLAKLGGQDPSGPMDGFSLPDVPGWTGPLVAGGVLGALGAGALTRWRRSGDS